MGTGGRSHMVMVNCLLIIRTTGTIHEDINTSFPLDISRHLGKPHQGNNTVTNSATRDQR